MVKGSQLLLITLVYYCWFLLEDGPHYFNGAHPGSAVHGMKERVFAP